MADEIDRAQAYDEFFRELALKKLTVQGSRFNVEHGTLNLEPAVCEECGEPIPEARRRAAPGCTRCVDCQTGFERIHTRWGAL